MRSAAIAGAHSRHCFRLVCTGAPLRSPAEAAWAARSRVAPGTAAVGVGAGVAVGVVVYAVAPLGLSKAATNPWLPGSDVDPLVLLAWILVLYAPVSAALVARQRHLASGSAVQPGSVLARQVLAAGLLTNLVGALLAATLGTGTAALMLRAAWLRNWLYHGQRQFFGIAGLRSVLDGNLAAITYSHELTASVDASILLPMCILFPLIALVLTGLPALDALGNAEAEQAGDPPRGGGGPPAPQILPDGPASGQLATLTRDYAEPGWTLMPPTAEPGFGRG